MPNFAEIANKKAEDIARPPLPPVGHYRWQVIKLPEVSTSNDGKWDIVNYSVRAVEAQDDVDPQSLEEYGKVNNIINSVRFMFNKEDEAEFAKTEYSHKMFLQRTLKCLNDGESISQGMNNAVNQQFIGNIVWKQDKNDNELFHANIGKHAPVE